MDGSPIDLILIPIVAVLSLIGWLVPIYWADSHPRWGGGARRGEQTGPSVAVPELPAAVVAPQPPPPGRHTASVPRQRVLTEDPAGLSGRDLLAARRAG